jgi:hypothetical protein
MIRLGQNLNQETRTMPTEIERLHQMSNKLQDDFNQIGRRLRETQDEIRLLATPTTRTETVVCGQCNGLGWWITESDVAGSLLFISRCSCEVGQNLKPDLLIKMLRGKFQRAVICPE